MATWPDRWVTFNWHSSWRFTPSEVLDSAVSLVIQVCKFWLWKLQASQVQSLVDLNQNPGRSHLTGRRSNAMRHLLVKVMLCIVYWRRPSQRWTKMPSDLLSQKEHIHWHVLSFDLKWSEPPKVTFDILFIYNICISIVLQRSKRAGIKCWPDICWKTKCHELAGSRLHVVARFTMISRVSVHR